MRLCRLCKKLLSDDQALCPEHASDPNPALNNVTDVSVEPLPEELAARFPRHEPFALGSSGTLYRLTDDSNAVLKVLHASLTRASAERARYRRELRRQQSLIQPQLARVHDVGETQDRIWFTRDFVQGESLAVRARSGETFDLASAYSIILQLSAALDALHQLGLVHRDVKPGHVLLRAKRSPRESLQLIDATVVGPVTPGYAAKELVEGAPATFRSDLYALGRLSYELLRVSPSAPPFRDATQNALGSVTASELASADAPFTAPRDGEPEELPDHVPQAV